MAVLDQLVTGFEPQQAAEIKAIEAVTNHDVKALEYWIKQQLANNSEVMQVSEFIHFACTSEDINNLSHALMLKAARDQTMLPMLDRVVAFLRKLAHEHADVAMMARTHGPVSYTHLDVYKRQVPKSQFLVATMASGASRGAPIVLVVPRSGTIQSGAKPHHGTRVDSAGHRGEAPGPARHSACQPAPSPLKN